MPHRTPPQVFSFLDSGIYDPKGQGARIAAARKAKGLNQTQLAKMIGVTPGAVSQWELGTVQEIGSWPMQRLCEALGISVRYLLTGIPPMSRAVHIEPDELDLLATYRELQPSAKEALIRRAHEYHEIAGPGVPTPAHPVRKPHKQ